MTRLLTALWPTFRSEPTAAPAGQHILRVEVPTDRWEPLPADIAEWMGMRPYQAEDQRRTA